MGSALSLDARVQRDHALCAAPRVECSAANWDSLRGAARAL